MRIHFSRFVGCAVRFGRYSPFLAVLLVPGISEAAPAETAATVEEARGRARLLHETFHGVLQIMHRDFFRKEDRTRIPSASLEDVFKVLAAEQKVKLSWLGVNAQVMDEEHEARTPFEKAAVKALDDGAPEFEEVESGLYQFAGAIQLHNSCLKCHVPYRTSLEDRVAALVITVPVAKAAARHRGESADLR